MSIHGDGLSRTSLSTSSLSHVEGVKGTTQEETKKTVSWIGRTIHVIKEHLSALYAAISQFANSFFSSLSTQQLEHKPKEIDQKSKDVDGYERLERKPKMDEMALDKQIRNAEKLCDGSSRILDGHLRAQGRLTSVYLKSRAQELQQPFLSDLIVDGKNASQEIAKFANFFAQTEEALTPHSQRQPCSHEEIHQHIQEIRTKIDELGEYSRKIYRVLPDHSPEKQKWGQLVRSLQRVSAERKAVLREDKSIEAGLNAAQSVLKKDRQKLEELRELEKIQNDQSL